MIKKIVTKVIVWIVQAVDIDIEKDGDTIMVEVTLYGKVLFTKRIPLRRKT